MWRGIIIKVEKQLSAPLKSGKSSTFFVAIVQTGHIDAFPAYSPSDG